MKRTLAFGALLAIVAVAVFASSASARMSGTFLGCPNGFYGVNYNGKFKAVDANQNHWYCHSNTGRATKDDG